jgi:NADH-quinone oxidoreductase subunit L
MIFFGEFRNEKVDIKSIHEGSWKMKFPIGILAILSTGFVFSLNPMSIEHGWFGDFIGGKFEENHLIGIISTSFALIGITAGYLTRHRIFTFQIPTFDNFYNKIFVNPTLKLSSNIQFFDQKLLDAFVDFLADLQVFIAKIVGWFDAKVIDGIPNGAAYSAGIIGRVTRSAQGGKVQLYVALAFLGLICLLVFVIATI